jgi:hypothetical protein
LSARTILLILPGAILPLSPVALTQAQAPRRDLETGYRDAWLLEADGTLRRIEAVRVLGPHGASVLRRLVSRLTGGWRIAVDLSAPAAWDIEALRARLVAGVQGADPWTDPARAVAALQAAATPETMVAALDLPAPEDALDVL